MMIIDGDAEHFASLCAAVRRNKVDQGTKAGKQKLF